MPDTEKLELALVRRKEGLVTKSSAALGAYPATLRLERAARMHQGEPVATASLVDEGPRPALFARRSEGQDQQLLTELDRNWAVLPAVSGSTAKLLETGFGDGTRLDALTGQPFELQRFFDLSIAITCAVRTMHERGIIHKDLKPANIVIDQSGHARLTGFALASSSPRERQATTAPEIIAGTLAYMSPEQTGRINRSIDQRSDLYSLGITLYEMLVGVLPFAASDPTEWVYCHIARLPPPPGIRIEGIPLAVESIILKLLAKNADDRYQTAAGLEFDLRRCQATLNSRNRVETFPLGERDRSDRLRIPETLYGRAAEIAVLADSFRDVVNTGQFGLVLVSGTSGIGKSSLVNELQPTLHAAGGLFAYGKFDQFKRDIPLHTIAGAFRGLVRQLLSQPDRELRRWRAALTDALGTCGQLITDIVPELELIIGAQSAPPILAAEDERARFQLIFRRFVGIFAQPQHPLVLFLDDLQWIDTASLALLERLSIDETVPCLLLVGAYRSNEVSAWHGLGRTLEKIASATGGLKEIRLSSLRLDDICLLVADTLHADMATVRPLGELVFAKTMGNPFFAGQFLTMLHVEGLIEVEADTGCWRWDLDRISAKSSTDNVTELMAARLNGFDSDAVTALKSLACLGSNAPVGTIAKILKQSRSQVETALRGFVADGLVSRSGDLYAFVHDRVHEAAYALVADEERAAVHLRIGRLLATDVDHKHLEENIFEIVNHFNLGSTLVTRTADRRRLAELNLIAGKRAKTSTAYESALTYLTVGRALVDTATWASNYQLAFELEFHHADCQFMIGETTAAEEQFARLAERPCRDGDHVLLISRQVMLYTYIGRIDHALELSIGCLRHMGVDLPVSPTHEDIEHEYNELRERVRGRDVDELLDLPLIAEPHWQDIMGLLGALLGPAGVLNGDLLDLVLLRTANVSIEHGNSHHAPHAYANLGARVFSWRFKDFDTARKLGTLAMRLIDERGLNQFAAKAFAIVSGYVGPWNMPLRDCYHIALRAIDMPRERGGITYSGYAWVCGMTALLDSGKSLSEVERLAEVGLAFAERAKFLLVVEFLKTQLAFVRALRGSPAMLQSLNPPDCTEAKYESYLASVPHLLHAHTRFLVRKLQQRYYAGDYAECVRISRAVGGGIGESPVLNQSPVFEIVEYCFFSALGRAAFLASDGGGVAADLAELRHGHSVLEEWAARCPENVLGRAKLVEAEIAKLDGRELDAHYLYEAAAQHSREQGFLQVEALANELAARFHGRRGFDVIAEAYFRSARSCYARWGADAKARQLDLASTYPGRSTDAATGGLPQLRNLDFGAVVEMHQAVSREIVLDRVIERLMSTVVGNAGAVRGLLLLPNRDSMAIVAEALPDASGVSIRSQLDHKLDGELPQSILTYVARTHDEVIIDDAWQAGAFASDPYILTSKPRSVLCLPLLKQKRLVGVLYLENNLVTHLFTKERLAVLQLLASQAAISIENANLFRDLQTTQEHARRTRDELKSSFDMIPALAWRAAPDGAVEFSNKQWHDYTGVSRDDASRGTWMRAIHPEDIDRVTEKWRHLGAFRTSGEFEARMRRFDGEFRRFLVRLSPMRDENGNVVNWHGTSTDIENLKRAEQAQEALARVSRVTALGELTVSIAHEINQPLMAIVTNAATCARWLASDPPNVVEARRAAERIVRDGHRAGDVVAGIRSLARKSVSKPVAFDLNEAILEVLLLLRNEVDGHGIATRTELASDVGLVIGDRVQVQQVVMNLVLNAIEAMSPSAMEPHVLEVGSRRLEDGEVQIDVSDSGVGLDPAIGDQIFEVFVTTKADGIGIGLAICRSIVEAHRGRLWTSPNKPCGTCFHFSLPTGTAGALS